MRNSLWISLDLLRDAMTSGAFLIMGFFLAGWLPLQAGILDGLTDGLLLARSHLTMRGSLVMNAAWPVLAMVGIQAHVFLPRRISREIEPLAALPVTDLQIALGLVLPVLAAALISAPMTFALNIAGFRLTAGRFPPGAVPALADLWLGTLTAGFVLGAAALHGSLRSRGQAGFGARVAAGYAVLGGIDALLYVCRLLGTPGLARTATAACLLAGIGVFWWIAKLADRERLVLGA